MGNVLGHVRDNALRDVKGKVDGKLEGCELGLLLELINVNALGNVLGDVEDDALGDVEGKLDDLLEECALGLLLGLVKRWAMR